MIYYTAPSSYLKNSNIGKNKKAGFHKKENT